MGLLTFIARNILNRPARTALTVLGLAVAIASVILLTGVSWGFEESMKASYESRGISLIVVRAGISDQLSSTLDESMLDAILVVPDVESAEPSLLDALAFEDANLVSVLANGWKPGGLLLGNLHVLSGRAIDAGDDRRVMLGRVLALNLGKKAGDQLSIFGESFEVVGIYESSSLFETGGLVMPLTTLQKMMGREGRVTGFVVVGRPSADVRALGRAIEGRIPGVAAIPSNDYVNTNLQIRLARAMAAATIAVSLALGSIGLLNTMAMTVFERTSEIGLLRAIGWKRQRIMLLLISEAAMLGLLGVVAGSALALIGIRLLAAIPTSRGFIGQSLPPAAFGIGLLMGLTLGLLGGLYPAYRASRLEPTEALRHV